MDEHGYLFSAGVTTSQMRPSGVRGVKTLQTWDTCVTAIVCGEDEVRAQKAFEDWCRRPSGDGDPAETEIKKIVGAQVIGQLLSESGDQRIEWPEISHKVMESIQAAESEADPPPESEDPGYWADVNLIVPAKSAHVDMESLRRGLPEGIGSGLNWSPDRKFLFLLSSLSAPPVVTDPYEEMEESGFDEAGNSTPMRHRRSWMNR